MLVVDSSVLVDHLRGVAASTAFLVKSRKTGPVWVPALVAWELWRGATTRPREAAVRELLASLEPDAFTPAMAELAGDLYRSHRRGGKERPVFDLLIASHAIHRNVPLATVDVDYSFIEGLEVLRP